MAKFSKGEAIKFGCSTVTGNLGLFVFAVLTVLIIQLMPVLLTESLVVMDTPLGSVGTDALGAIKSGDIPGIAAVIVDGEVITWVSRKSKTN